MTKIIWKEKLDAFLERESMEHAKDEDVFVPRKHVRIIFWIDGGPKVAGSRANLVVNFNDPELIVLSLQVRKTVRIYRIPYSRVACVELLHGTPDEEEGAPRRAALN